MTFTAGQYESCLRPGRLLHEHAVPPFRATKGRFTGMTSADYTFLRGEIPVISVVMPIKLQRKVVT